MKKTLIVAIVAVGMLFSVSSYAQQNRQNVGESWKVTLNRMELNMKKLDKKLGEVIQNQHEIKEQIKNLKIFIRRN